MNDSQLPKGYFPLSSTIPAETTSEPSSVLPQFHSRSTLNVTKEELLKMEYLYAYNSLMQVEAKLEQNPRNKYYQKDRIYWLDQIVEIRKNIAENGQSLESVQATVNVAQTKFAIQQQSKTQTYCIGSLVLLIVLFTIASLCSAEMGENGLKFAFFTVLCCLLFCVFLTLFIIIILRNCEKRNR